MPSSLPKACPALLASTGVIGGRVDRLIHDAVETGIETGLMRCCRRDMLAIETARRYVGMMAKQDSDTRSSKMGRSVVVRTSKAARGSSKVKFGNVVVTSTKPSPAAVKTNVERSSKALERVSKVLVKPGVVIRSKKDVPRFSASESEPGVFIRQLNGRTERGHLVEGAFRVIE